MDLVLNNLQRLICHKTQASNQPNLAITVSLQRGKTLLPNECPRYDTKQSDGEVPVMLELWECGVPLHDHCSQVHSGPEW